MRIGSAVPARTENPLDRDLFAFWCFVASAILFALAGASALGRGFTVNERAFVDFGLVAGAIAFAVLHLR